ncbi:MAG: chaperone NapD [Pseudomonadota bacterium]
MNTSAILVQTAPRNFDAVVKQLNATDGVEVHHTDPATGRMIITQEAPDVEAEVEGLKHIRSLPGVSLAELVYHYFGDSEDHAERPEDAPTPGAVIDYLNVH